jgi:hypothetical protein
MEEAAHGAKTVEVKEEKEMGQAEAVHVKPSGAARTPIPKVRLHPATRGVGKKQKQPQDAVYDKANIVQLLYPLPTTAKIPTYKPPVFDQVMETAKVSTKKKPSPPGSPVIGKKHNLRFKEGPAFSKFPKKMMSGPATEMVATKGKKRKAESQSTVRRKKGKLMMVPGVAPQGTKRKAETSQEEGLKKGKFDYKRKAETEFTERMKKGRLTGPRDAAMKAKINMSKAANPKKKSKK